MYIILIGQVKVVKSKTQFDIKKARRLGKDEIAEMFDSAL